MRHISTITRRALLVAAVLMTTTAALGFSQGAPKGTSNGAPGIPSEPGVLVISVEPGSPAEKAGIARGDIIMDVNGAAVNTQADTREAVASHKTGDTLTLKVRHGDAEKTVSVSLDARDGRAYLGVLLLPDGRQRLGMRDDMEQNWPWLSSQGAIVSHVASRSPADKAGLKQGDVISVNADHNLSSLIQQKKSGDTITLAVQSVGQQGHKSPRDVKVTLGSSPNTKGAWLGVSYRMASPIADLMKPWDGQGGFEVPSFSMPEAIVPDLTAPAI